MVATASGSSIGAAFAAAVGTGISFFWPRSRDSGARHDRCVCRRQSDSRLPSSSGRLSIDSDPTSPCSLVSSGRRASFHRCSRRICGANECPLSTSTITSSQRHFKSRKNIGINYKNSPRAVVLRSFFRRCLGWTLRRTGTSLVDTPRPISWTPCSQDGSSTVGASSARRSPCSTAMLLKSWVTSRMWSLTSQASEETEAAVPLSIIFEGLGRITHLSKASDKPLSRITKTSSSLEEESSRRPLPRKSSVFTFVSCYRIGLRPAWSSRKLLRATLRSRPNWRTSLPLRLKTEPPVTIGSTIDRSAEITLWTSNIQLILTGTSFSGCFNRKLGC